MKAPSRLETTRNESVFDSHQVEQNLPMVLEMARRIAMRAPANIRAEDLIGAGTLGLMDSVRRNNGGTGPSLACYMRTRIKGAIQDELRAFDWLPRRARAQNKGGSSRGAPRPVAVIAFGDLPPGPERHPASGDPSSDPMEAAALRARNESLREAISVLQPRERLVLNLHYFNDMRLREISRFLGVTEARVSQIHHRALSKLRPVLKRAA